MKVLNPMNKATSGTITGIKVALDKGWWINFAGGYHHAQFTKGGGFWVYPDISLAVYFAF